MNRERRSADRKRREILCGDLDRLTCARRLWEERTEVDPHADRRSRAVRDAMASALTEKQRQVVEAYFFEGLSQGEIARCLGVTQQVVQKRLYGAPRGGRLVGGAIARLRAALSPLFPSNEP
jgi:RNA polymerase sigma factor (sigma-70 family)